MSARSEVILTEAARLFAAVGYGATSIDDIGTAAGVSGPAIYWHFTGKQALLAEMLVDISQRLLAEGRRRVASAVSDEDALAQLVDGQVSFALRESDLIVVHARELRHLDASQAHRVRLLQRQYVDVWVGVLERLNPEVPRNRLAAAVQAAIGLINSTPYIGRIDRGALGAMLRSMALGASYRRGPHFVMT